ncbi:hypothetical protein D3C85_1437880 [compost metagenome]
MRALPVFIRCLKSVRLVPKDVIRRVVNGGFTLTFIQPAVHLARQLPHGLGQERDAVLQDRQAQRRLRRDPHTRAVAATTQKTAPKAAARFCQISAPLAEHA